MENLLSAPIDAGKVRLARIQPLEVKSREEVEAGQTKRKMVFRHAWKFFVENRREDTIQLTFHFSVYSAKAEQPGSLEFVMKDIPSFTAAGNVFRPAGEDEKLVLDSMQVQGEQGEIEVTPINLELGYTGSYTQIAKAGKKLGSMLGKISNSFRSGLKE
ncbi:MAG: hypothetical protein D6730_01495 [Bacteroidetes bacterium]|nr:MAG: hypothetical protein D6730_01495 [Bacteroidota bacterium]